MAFWLLIYLAAILCPCMVHSLVQLKSKTCYLMSSSSLNQHALLICILVVKPSINVCHRFTVLSIAINFGLIHHGIMRFKLIGDGRAWKVDGRAQVLVGLSLDTPLNA